MHLLVDILFPSKYAKWRIEETKAFIDKGADILVNKLTSFAGINYNIDYEEMAEYFCLSDYNIIIFDSNFNHLNKFNKNFDGTKFNNFCKFSYLFTKKTEFNLNNYKSVYHIFLSNYIKFNEEFKYPQHRQFIHLYPGGGLSKKENLQVINPACNIISTQKTTDNWLATSRFKNFISCYGSTCLSKDAKLVEKTHNPDAALNVCFSSMGIAEFKGVETYNKIVEKVKELKLNVNFFSIGNFPKNANVTSLPPMSQSDLDKFYHEKIDILINSEPGKGFNGWPLGIEAALQGVVLITTDCNNSNAQFNYTNYMLRMIKVGSVNDAVKHIMELNANRVMLAQMSKNIQLHSYKCFSYEKQQERIFKFIDEQIGQPKALNCYYITCPKTPIDDYIYKIKNKSLKTLHPNNIIIQKDNVFQHVLDCVKNNTPISLARYNDGEWICMLKLEKNNLYNIHKAKWDDKADIFVKNKLLPIIQSKPEYPIGISTEVLTRLNLINEIWPHINELSLFDGGVFARKSCDIELVKLFNLLKDKKVILLGPEHCQKMKKMFDFTHIKTPNKIWNHYENIKSTLFNNLQKSENNIILYSCSFVAKVLIDEVYKQFPNNIQLDLGAVFEPYCGVDSRPWHKYITVEIN